MNGEAGGAGGGDGILGFHCCGPGSIPDWGTETLQAARHGQKMKRKKPHILSDFKMPSIGKTLRGQTTVN